MLNCKKIYRPNAGPGRSGESKGHGRLRQGIIRAYGPSTATHQPEASHEHGSVARTYRARTTPAGGGGTRRPVRTASAARNRGREPQTQMTRHPGMYNTCNGWPI